MINKERLQLGLDALRSGEYQQGTLRLCTITPGTGQLKFCCLGVLTEVAIANGLEGLEYVGGYEMRGYQEIGEPLPEYGVLPRLAKDWYGFGPAIPSVQAPDVQAFDIEVTLLNDEHGWTLAQIADAIEAKYIREEQ